MIDDDDDFDKMMAELDSDAPAAPAPPPAPSRRGKKTQTVITSEPTNPEPALAAKVAEAKPADDGFVKIAGLNPEPAESVKVIVVEDAPAREPYISPQTKAEMDAGRAVLNRFK